MVLFSCTSQQTESNNASPGNNEPSLPASTPLESSPENLNVPVNDKYKITGEDLTRVIELKSPDVYLRHQGLWEEYMKSDFNDVTINQLNIEGEIPFNIVWTNKLYYCGLFFIFSEDKQPLIFDEFHKQIISVSHEQFLNAENEYDNFVIIKSEYGSGQHAAEAIDIYYINGDNIKKLNRFEVFQADKTWTETIDNKQYVVRGCMYTNYRLFQDRHYQLVSTALSQNGEDISQEWYEYRLGLMLNEKWYNSLIEADGTEKKIKDVGEITSIYMFDDEKKEFVQIQTKEDVK